MNKAYNDVRTTSGIMVQHFAPSALSFR